MGMNQNVFHGRMAVLASSSPPPGWRGLRSLPDAIWKRIIQLRPIPTTTEVPPVEEQIASVARDETDVIWEQRTKDVEAEKRRPLTLSTGFSFSAAGLLFPYHLGVCQSLMDRSYITDKTPLAGASAGALVCAVVASGMSMERALVATKELAEDCRKHGTAFRLGAVLRRLLEKLMPEDAHLRASGRIRVAITQVFRAPRGLLVDQFDSREDLINALLTSCFLPGYLAPRPVTVFKNRICIDGGFTLFMPPTAAEQTVRVCALPAGQLGLGSVVSISPDCNPVGRANARQLFNWALEPASDDILEELFRLGYKDAEVWAEANPLPLIQHESSGGTAASQKME